MSDNSDIIKKEPLPKAPDWWHEDWLKAYAETGNVGRACSYVKVNRDTAYNHRKLFPEFARQWDELRELHTDEIEQVAVERALSSKSDTMLIFLLKSRRPEIYRETVNQNIRFGNMTDVELTKFIQSRTRGISGGDSGS